MASTKHSQWRKMASVPNLTQCHRTSGINYAASALRWGEKWQADIFSDEKKFNLDGPDGFLFYWRDLRHEPRSVLRRNFGGSSVLICTAVSQKGKSEIAFLSGRYTSENYRSTLDNFVIPFAARNHKDSFIFTQYNAAIHKSSLLQHLFEDRRIL